MDATQAETAIRFLSWQFGVQAPKVRFNGRKGSGHYKRHGVLCLAKRVEPWLVAHEFTHHLDRCLNFNPRTYWREWHSESFYFNLRRVISALAIRDYPWATEYKQLARWARRDGLIPKEPTR